MNIGDYVELKLVTSFSPTSHPGRKGTIIDVNHAARLARISFLCCEEIHAWSDFTVISPVGGGGGSGGGMPSGGGSGGGATTIVAPPPATAASPIAVGDRVFITLADLVYGAQFGTVLELDPPGFMRGSARVDLDLGTSPVVAISSLVRAISTKPISAKPIPSEPRPLPRKNGSFEGFCTPCGGLREHRLGCPARKGPNGG